MCKRIVTIIMMITTSTLFLNEMARARAFVLFSNSTSSKERKKSCLPCAAAQGNSAVDPLDALATMGRRTQILPLKPLQRSLFDGSVVNLVSTATGQLSFTVTDLEIKGSIPLTFERAYNSDNSEDRGLGLGWSFVFDDRIKLSGDTAILSTGTGSLINFRKEGQRFVLKTAEPSAHQTFNLASDNSIIEQAPGLTRTYRKEGASYRLSQIVDANGNTVKIAFDSQGNISQISSSTGATLTLEWSEGASAQLLAVTDNANRRVSFKRDGRRFLRTVTDAAGAEWSYQYQGGQLTQANDPAGRVLLRVRYDRRGRAVEAGDAAGTNLYEYDSATNDISRRTVLTDPRGLKTIFEHTERGSLSGISNGGETLLQVDYNAMNRPTRIANPLTGDTVFNYDAQNRLVNRASSDGAFQAFAYDERGQVSSTTTNTGRTDYVRDEHGLVIQAKSNDPSESYKAVYNSRGQTISITSVAGNTVTFEYDASGNTAAYSTSKAGRLEIETDAVGRATSRRLPTGTLYRYEYDPRGLVVKQSDNRGRSMIFEREESGAVTGVITESGHWMRATRDEAGRIIALKTSAGKSRRFAYDARGALIDYTDARGQHKHFNYDKRGRLESVESEGGNHTVFERDEKGKVKRVWSFHVPKGKESGSSQDARLVAFTERFGLPHLLPASYNVNLPLVTTPQGVDCFFDFSDGFIDTSDSSFGFGLECSDPFGEWGGEGGGGGGFGDFNPFFDPIGETCAACIARQVEICVLSMRTCLLKLIQSGSTTAISCIGAFVAGGVGGIICIGLLVDGLGAGGRACQSDYEVCLLQASDKCPQC